jgi:hypothetical protein
MTMPDEPEESKVPPSDRGDEADEDTDPDCEDAGARYLRHRDDDRASVGSPGIGGGTGGYRDRQGADAPGDDGEPESDGDADRRRVRRDPVAP